MIDHKDSVVHRIDGILGLMTDCNAPLAVTPMLSWWSALPLPSSIQTRFVSFLLRRSLGHLLLPGQLDPDQIVSQLGSGVVHVSNILLDPVPVDQLLSSLHLPLHLHSGHIETVTARVPWPNPLTSVVGLAVDGLHLLFHLRPSESPSDHLSSSAVLADSVASLSDSFIHSELSPHEEAQLRDSFLHDPSAALDPFLSEPSSALPEHDPAGIPIFASLIERLLARFQFDATNIHVSIEIPGKLRFVIFVGQAVYRDVSPTPDTGDPPSAKEREISVSDLRVSLVDLTIDDVSTASQPATPPPDSPSGSDDMDEQTELMMSQSLAFLPPRSSIRPSNPLPSASEEDDDVASSVSSSLYQSALEQTPPAVITHTPPETPTDTASTPSVLYAAPTTPPSPSRQDVNNPGQTIFSLGRDPLLVRLTTPPPSTDPSPDNDRLKLSITSGVLSCALRAYHLQQLGALVTVLTLKRPSTTNKSESTTQLAMDIDMSVKGLVVILLPESGIIDQAFWIRPLLPPNASSGSCLKLWLQDLGACHSMASLTAKASEFWVGDLSLFAFTPAERDGKLLPSPVLITDPNLPDGYNPAVIEVLDWTEEERRRQFGARASMWRSKAKSAAQLDKALRVVWRERDLTLDIHITPLHSFLDLGCAAAVKTFFTIVSSGQSNLARPQQNPQSDHEDSDVDEQERERRRLENMLIRDLDLDLDYTTARTANKQHKKSRSRNKAPGSPRLTLHLPFLRIQARCPPPLHITSSRSGALVIDIQGVIISNSQSTSYPSRARFASTSDVLQVKNATVFVDCAQVNIAATSATSTPHPAAGKIISSAILELSPLGSLAQEGMDVLKPRLVVGSIKEATIISIDIPAVKVTMSKAVMDGLQYWADDASQVIERLSGDENATPTASRVIGSHYFAQSRRSDTSSSRSTRLEVKNNTELVVKVAISEAAIVLDLPRHKGGCRPFEVRSSDIEALVEVKPEGKDETVISFNAMNLTVQDMSEVESTLTMLTLTVPRSLDSVPNHLLKLRFASITIPETGLKQSRIQLSLWGFTFTFYPDLSLANDLASFFKAPPGAFESVPPSERTRVSVKVTDGSVKLLAPNHPGTLVAHIGDSAFSTDIVGGAETSSFHVNLSSLATLFIDNDIQPAASLSSGRSHWTSRGYALISELGDFQMSAQIRNLPPADTKIAVDKARLQLHLCADSMGEIGLFIASFSSIFKSTVEKRRTTSRRPTIISSATGTMMDSIEDIAFRSVPEVGPAPDLINDDLPTNLDYLDASFGAAAGLREFQDDDLDDFDMEEQIHPVHHRSPSFSDGVISKVGGETIKMLKTEGIQVVENYFNTLPPENIDDDASISETLFQLQLRDFNLFLYLYEGYDWAKTRKTIEDEVKEMKRRLAKIRQLVASGQTQDTTVDGTSAVLFNSVYIGLNEDVNELEPGALIAAIDKELKEDDDETASVSSWQSFKPTVVPAGQTSRSKSVRIHGKRLTRGKSPSIEFQLLGTRVDFRQFTEDSPLASKVLANVENLEIVDRMKSSTWKKFLTDLRSDSSGNIRETGSNMVRVELRSVRPVPGHPSEEARLRAKILPLRLYVDQDALDFLKKFFSFKDPHATSELESSEDKEDIYFQSVEIFPVDLKLDYKPRRVDYRALREGRTIELMNFFHFDGAEMTLRHITLNGITGWPRMFDLLNDLWTPDVKATQLVEVISGVAPIRSVVNVGSGVADLVLLPIAQYKKDGRIVRGVQKGTQAFVKSTATEAIKLGARLATGTQVILEQAEGVLGRQFKAPIMVEPVRAIESHLEEGLEENDMISKYAQQPVDLREGFQSAYKSLRTNLNSAAQTILAVPMEVYERQGNEGPVRSVIRAVPIAVLKPMIGASEAISKTLLGLHNTLDPEVRHENEAKYKHR